MTLSHFLTRVKEINSESCAHCPCMSTAIRLIEYLSERVKREHNPGIEGYPPCDLLVKRNAFCTCGADTFNRDTQAEIERILGDSK